MAPNVKVTQVKDAHPRRAYRSQELAPSVTIQVGLMDGTWLARFAAPFGYRLQLFLHEPNGGSLVRD